MTATTFGPGKYNVQATRIREETHAKLVAVIVLDGAQGNGFSVQSESPDHRRVLAFLLESMARRIRFELAVEGN